MAIQKEADLNTPLDKDKTPSLAQSNLTPDLVAASLNLHGDFYRQLQSKFNRYVFWHPISRVIFVTSLVTGFVYRLWDYIVISDTILEFLSFFFKSNDFIFQIFTMFPILVVFFGVTGLSAYILGDDLRGISDNLLKKGYATEIFGFDVQAFSRLPVPTEESSAITSGATTSTGTLEKRIKAKKPAKDEITLENGKDTQIIIYRDSPIAIVTLNPQPEETNNTLLIKISGLHTRKVFAKVDFDGLLIDWAVIRAKEIVKETGSKVDKVVLEINGYTFDPQLAKTLGEKKFKVVSESYNFHSFEDKKVGPISMIFHKIFGFKKQVYQLEISL